MKENVSSQASGCPSYMTAILLKADVLFSIDNSRKSPIKAFQEDIPVQLHIDCLTNVY